MRATRRDTGRTLCSMMRIVRGAFSHQLCAGVQTRFTAPPINPTRHNRISAAAAPRGRPRRCRASTGVVSTSENNTASTTGTNAAWPKYNTVPTMTSASTRRGMVLRERRGARVLISCLTRLSTGGLLEGSLTPVTDPSKRLSTVPTAALAAEAFVGNNEPPLPEATDGSRAPGGLILLADSFIAKEASWRRAQWLR